jgi:hypothetical protein
MEEVIAPLPESPAEKVESTDDKIHVERSSQNVSEKNNLKNDETQEDNQAQPLTIIEAVNQIINDDLKSSLLAELKGKLEEHNLEIDTKTAMMCLRYAMEVVELSQLKGVEQKTMALELLRTLLDESSLDESKKMIVSSLLDEDILGSAVDIIVDATQGKLDVNHIQQVAENCCWAFLKSIGKNN